jgi:hypothetical protein
LDLAPEQGDWVECGAGSVPARLVSALAILKKEGGKNMSQEAVVQVVSRALLDGGFRKQLFAEPEAALKEFELTGPERVALSKIKPEAFDSFAGEVEKRVSKVMPITIPNTLDGTDPGPIPADLLRLVQGEVQNMGRGLISVMPITLP